MLDILADLETDHLVGRAVTVEATITGAAIIVHYLAPRTEPQTC